MNNSKGLRGSFLAATVAAGLFAAQPAAADIIELNNWWAGAGAVSIDFTGTDWHNGTTTTVKETAGAGGFKTYNLTTDPNRQNAFQSFCVDIFSSFGFSVSSNDTLQPATVISTEAAADLGLLYSNHHAEIDSKSSSATNEAAFQLAVWEIVNEGSGSYDLSNGNFKASGTGGSLAQQWLNELTGGNQSSSYIANIWTVDSMVSGRGHAQDVVVFTAVPEPEAYAMMLVGLGLLGFSVRRRNQMPV